MKSHNKLVTEWHLQHFDVLGSIAKGLTRKRTYQEGVMRKDKSMGSKGGWQESLTNFLK